MIIFPLFSPTRGGKGGREGRGGKTRGKVRRWIEWEEKKRGGGRGERGTWRRKTRDGEREKDWREEEKQK